MRMNQDFPADRDSVKLRPVQLDIVLNGGIRWRRSADSLSARSFAKATCGQGCPRSVPPAAAANPSTAPYNHRADGMADFGSGLASSLASAARRRASRASSFFKAVATPGR